MAKIDKQKEYIGFLKAIFITLIAIDTSMVAWLFNHPKMDFYSIIVLFGILNFSIAIIVLFRYILKKIDELEEL